MNGITFQFTASSFPAQVTDTKSFNTRAMDGWTVQTRAWGQENYNDKVRSKSYGFCVKMPDGNTEKPNCAILKFRMKIEPAEKLRDRKSLYNTKTKQKTHAQQN